MKEKVGSIIATLLAIALFLGIRACAAGKDVTEHFKDAKSYLKDTGYKVRLYDEEEEINEMLKEMFDVTAEQPVEALLAYNEDAEDAFVMVRCADTAGAEELAYSLVAFMVLENPYSYEKGYITDMDYTTVYMGHQDIVEHLCEK